MLCRTIISDFKKHTLLWLRGVCVCVCVCVKYNIIFLYYIFVMIYCNKYINFTITINHFQFLFYLHQH